MGGTESPQGQFFAEGSFRPFSRRPAIEAQGERGLFFDPLDSPMGRPCCDDGLGDDLSS